MLFLDSAEPSEIREIFSWGVVSGVTVNPRVVAREAGPRDLETRVREIIDVSWGSVSVELTEQTEDEMLREAITYHAWDPERVCVQMPFSEVGLKVLHQLSARGVSTNMTSVTTFNQGYLAALAGADYVTVFSGRVRDLGYDVRPIIRDIRAIFEREKQTSKLIVGSVRQVTDVNEALQDGAHIVAVPQLVLHKMLRTALY